MLREMSELNFVGYVEGRDLSKELADVVVCDGFVGNVVLKTMEASVGLVLNGIKECTKSSALAKLGLWLARPSLRRLFEVKFDPSAYGGAPLLGLKKTAIVCHGSSNERAILNAVRVAHTFEQDNLISQLDQALGSFNAAEISGYEDGVLNRVEQRLEKKSGIEEVVSTVESRESK
jgi:glycerol-3-phosphate acyltransferase PlsX